MIKFQDNFELTENSSFSEKTKVEKENNQTNQIKPNVSIIAKNNISFSNNTTAGGNKIILNKTSELGNLKEDKITQIPVLGKDLNKTNQAKEKLTVTVKFEVKNNTNLLRLPNRSDQMKIVD